MEVVLDLIQRQEWEELFDHIDKEFENGLCKSITRDRHGVFWNFTKKYVLIINQDGDGQLSWSEFKKLGYIDCDEDKRAALEAFNEIDADGDGQVNKGEFIKIMSKYIFMLIYTMMLHYWCISKIPSKHFSEAKCAAWWTFTRLKKFFAINIIMETELVVFLYH